MNDIISSNQEFGSETLQRSESSHINAADNLELAYLVESFTRISITYNSVYMYLLV